MEAAQTTREPASHDGDPWPSSYGLPAQREALFRGVVAEIAADPVALAVLLDGAARVLWARYGSRDHEGRNLEAARRIWGEYRETPLPTDREAPGPTLQAIIDRCEQAAAAADED